MALRLRSSTSPSSSASRYLRYVCFSLTACSARRVNWLPTVGSRSCLAYCRIAACMGFVAVLIGSPPPTWAATDRNLPAAAAAGHTGSALPGAPVRPEPAAPARRRSADNEPQPRPNIPTPVLLPPHGALAPARAPVPAAGPRSWPSSLPVCHFVAAKSP